MTTFNEIVTMITYSCNKHFQKGCSGIRDKIIECATQIYIEQMKINNSKGENNNDTV